MGLLLCGHVATGGTRYASLVLGVADLCPVPISQGVGLGFGASIATIRAGHGTLTLTAICRCPRPIGQGVGFRFRGGIPAIRAGHSTLALSVAEPCPVPVSQRVGLRFGGRITAGGTLHRPLMLTVVYLRPTAVTQIMIGIGRSHVGITSCAVAVNRVLSCVIKSVLGRGAVSGSRGIGRSTPRTAMGYGMVGAVGIGIARNIIAVARPPVQSIAAVTTIICPATPIPRGVGATVSSAGFGVPTGGTGL